MKKIIKRRIYDTETAKKIGSWNNNLPQEDLNYYTEELFRKKSGEYFLCGSGGSQSPYGDWDKGGFAIRPMSCEAAQKWAEEHLPTEKFLKEFSIENDNEITRISFVTTQKYRKKIEMLAVSRNSTISVIVREIIENYIKEVKV